ncbi:MAG TPA: ABC transporter permease [Gammaproteobacteria bacterium]
MNIESVAQDVRYAVRTLGRSPGFTVVAVLILALGIGANTAIFSLVSAVLLRPLPLEEPDRVVVLWEDFSSVGGPARVEPAPANYVDWKDRSRSFEDMAALESLSYNLTGEGEPERLAAIRTTANLFSLLGMQPLLGRTFVPDDEGPNASPVVVVSQTLWMRRFGGDPDLIGRSINLDGLNRTVIGVVPPDFRFPDRDAVVWVPASFTPEQLARRDAHYLNVVARLAPGTALPQAQAELTAIAKTLEQEYPASNTGMGATIAALHEHMARDARPTLFILLGAVGIVLLITCTNVANLLLARGAGRLKELALRKALGAAHGRIVRQLITESAVLAAVSVAIGIVISTLSFGYLARLMPGTFPEGAGPGFDWRVLTFTAGIALSTVLLFGAGPALAAARLDVNESLKKSVGQSGTRRKGRMRDALVVGEITLTVVLLVAAGLLLRSYAQILAVDVGFRPQNLLIAETALSPNQYGEAATRAAFYERVLERVSALPGVAGAGYVNFPPLTFKGGRVGVTIDGRPAPAPEDFVRYITSDRAISSEYLKTLGVPLVSGRHFDERDTPSAPPGVIINEAMVRLHWPDGDPIGERLKIGNSQTEAPWFTIVGVVGNVRQMGLDVPAEPEMYFSFNQLPFDAPFLWPRHLVVRTEGQPMALADAVRNAVWEADPNQPVSSVRSMSEIFDAELANRNTQLTLVGGFAVLALLVASVGLYGVLSYTVAQRTPEIGLRMALGAERGNVVGSVLRGALLLAALGIVLGIAFAFGLTRLLSSFLFGVSPTDPATFAAVSAVLLLVTGLASYLPARRAASVDPVTALRTE